MPRSVSPSGSPKRGGHASLGVVTLGALIVFIVSFAFSLGPVTWTVINEIYPGDIRGRAVAVATAVNWGAAFLVSEFFLSIVKAIGQAYAFWLFAAFCALGLVWVICRRARNARPLAGGDRNVVGPGARRSEQIAQVVSTQAALSERGYRISPWRARRRSRLRSG